MIQIYSVLTTKYMHLSFQINYIKLTVLAGKETFFVLEALLVDNLKPSCKSPTTLKTQGTRKYSIIKTWIWTISS